jgi:predicted permease
MLLMSPLQPSDILLFVVPIVLAAALLWGMHFYPWNRRAKPLEPISAYTMGTAVVVGMPIAAMLTAVALDMRKDELFWALHLAVSTCTCGITVKVAYLVDDSDPISLDEVNHNGNGQ